MAISQFIQRDPATGTGTINFTGTEAGLYQNGVHIATSTTGQFLNIPEGGDYVMKVLNADGSVTRSKIVIGAIIDTMGASNMGHWFSSPPNNAPVANTYELSTSGVWALIHGEAAQDFAAKLSASLGCPVALLDTESSGSALLKADATSPHTWWDNGPAYTAALDVIQSIGGRVEDVLWAGGEPDGLKHVSESAFEAGLADLFSHIEADMGAPQIFIQQIGNCNNPNAQPYFNGIWTAEQQVTELLNYAHIGANGMTATLADAHHYTDQSYINLANTMAASIATYDGTPPPPPPTTTMLTADSTSGYLMVNGESVVVDAGVTIIDASEDGTTRTAAGCGVGDQTGGDNSLTVWGEIRGFVGAYFDLGSNSVVVQDGGSVYGFNAGVEFHNDGQDALTVDAGGTVEANDYGIWCGATPHVDYHDLPDAGGDLIRNFGLIEADRREAIRMVFGDNHINNAGTIQANFEQAIEIDSDVTDTRNTIENSGTITAGPRGAAIISGDAPITITNTGTINGDIDLGAGNDIYQGATGVLNGVLNGGAGNDTLVAGNGNETLDGGAGGDAMTCGTGIDTFVFAGAADSTGGTGVDIITGFDFSKDLIVVAGQTISTFDHIQALDTLRAGHAAIAQNSTGVYIVVDENGVAGYQAGADLLIKLDDAHNIPTG